MSQQSSLTQSAHSVRQVLTAYRRGRCSAARRSPLYFGVSGKQFQVAHTPLTRSLQTMADLAHFLSRAAGPRDCTKTENGDDSLLRLPHGRGCMRDVAAQKYDRLTWAKAHGYQSFLGGRSDARKRLGHSFRIEVERAGAGGSFRIAQAGDHRDVAFVDVAMEAEVIARPDVIRVGALWAGGPHRRADDVAEGLHELSAGIAGALERPAGAAEQPPCRSAAAAVLGGVVIVVLALGLRCETYRLVQQGRGIRQSGQSVEDRESAGL